MNRRNLIWLTVIGTLALAAVILVDPGTPLLEAGSPDEYKFVRLVDDGAMPVITEALNREAERGWALEEMAVTAGEPGTIYLVFRK